MTLRAVFAVLLCLVLTACDDKQTIKQTRLYAFGTEINISLYGVEQQVANNLSLIHI